MAGQNPAIRAVKAEIKQELHAEEMRQLMQQQLITEELQRTVDDSKAAIEDINTAVEALADTKKDLHDDKPA